MGAFGPFGGVHKTEETRPSSRQAGRYTARSFEMGKVVMAASILAGLVAISVMAFGFWLSAPIRGVWRWLFRLAMLVLVMGLILPPPAIDWLRDQLSVLLPLARELGDAPTASAWAHVLLFCVISGLSFWFREDLRRWQLAALLGVLALVMEGVQLLIDGRFGSWFDVGLNLLGVTIGALFVVGLRWVFPDRR